MLSMGSNMFSTEVVWGMYEVKYVWGNVLIYIYIYISADPCRQQGERVREEIPSSVGRGPQARSVPQGPAVSLWRGRRL